MTFALLILLMASMRVSYLVGWHVAWNKAEATNREIVELLGEKVALLEERLNLKK